MVITMLEHVDLQRKMTKVEYRMDTDVLKRELALLQHTLKDKGLPVIVLFEGWGAAGKGSLISDMILTLDPRSYKVFSTVSPTAEERRRPWLWRHWCRIPERGRIAVFDRSWYPETSIERIEGNLSEAQAKRRLESVNRFERQLTDDGYLVIKFFLHISQKEQKKRLKKLSESKETQWRATRQDWERNEKYEEYYKVFDEMLEATDTECAPWHLIGCTDRRSALSEVYHIMVDSIRQALAEGEERKAAAPKQDGKIDPGPFSLVKIPSLREVSLDKMAPENYKELLKEKQEHLRAIHNRLYLQKVPVVIVYEGWDAAGKGGNIKRLAAALDPRGYEVVPIAAPTPTELSHHYLWRFWEGVPKDGHVAIFDRSWYGRLMVERIEGFCTPEEWHRAYREINEFEKELFDRGAILLKFWIHIDKDEQLRRFNDRENTPEKRWKITDEDWRNREKWDQYEIAVDDMLRYTSTDFAPWTIVESQDKKLARLKTLDTVIAAAENRL